MACFGISPGWAFLDHHIDRGAENRAIYDDLRENFEISVSRGLPQKDYPKYDIVIEDVMNSGGKHDYLVRKNAPELSVEELALIADGGNLCFGFSAAGDYITIYTD